MTDKQIVTEVKDLLAKLGVPSSRLKKIKDVKTVTSISEVLTEVI